MSKVTDYVNNEAVISFTSETAFTLPSYNTRTSLTIKNLSTPDLTLTAFGSELIDGNATYVVGGNSTAKLVRGKTGWVVVEGSDSSITGVFNVTNATDATSIATGAIVTAGGIGATKALWVGGLANVAGVATLANATASTSTTTGGTKIAGGLGVVGDVYAASYNTTGGGINYNKVSQAVGTVYTLTNSAAKVTLGTTSPTVVLDKAGTYLIFASAQLEYTGATVVAETATFKVRRSNNTAADLSSLVIVDLPIATTLTHNYGIIHIPPFVYTTAATDDSVEVWANVSAGLGAGTLTISPTGTKITAVRLY